MFFTSLLSHLGLGMLLSSWIYFPVRFSLVATWCFSVLPTPNQHNSLKPHNSRKTHNSLHVSPVQSLTLSYQRFKMFLPRQNFWRLSISCAFCMRRRSFTFTLPNIYGHCGDFLTITDRTYKRTSPISSCGQRCMQLHNQDKLRLESMT
jgi:hypothetical protein